MLSRVEKGVLQVPVVPCDGSAVDGGIGFYVGRKEETARSG